MDVPSHEEIEDLAIVLEEKREPHENSRGQMRRILLQILKTRKIEKDFEQTVNEAVDEATEDPRYVFKAIANHTSSKVRGSSTVFFIKPKSETHRTLPSVYVPTRWLAKQLVDALYRRQEDKRAEFFGIMRARSTLGWMFEAVSHRFLAEEENLTIHWSKGKTETLALPLLQTFAVLDDLKNLQPSYYWCLPSSNFPGIDSAIVTPRRVFGIQATIRSEHSPPTDGVKTLRKKFPANNRKWTRFRVLFVGFSDQQAKSVADAYDGRVSQKTRLRVGWLTAPLGGGFEALRQAFETEEDEEEAIDEEQVRDDEATDEEDATDEDEE